MRKVAVAKPSVRRERKPGSPAKPRRLKKATIKKATVKSVAPKKPTAKKVVTQSTATAPTFRSEDVYRAFLSYLGSRFRQARMGGDRERPHDYLYLKSPKAHVYLHGTDFLAQVMVDGEPKCCILGPVMKGMANARKAARHWKREIKQSNPGFETVVDPIIDVFSTD